MPRIALAFVAVVAAASPVSAGSTLQPGAYAVRETLELPNVEDMDASRTQTLCLTAEGSHGIMVMSENNPLTRCPISNVQETGDTMTFDIRCKGVNEAKASAVYTMMGDAFRGRIAMQMGGKNMTMTEVQEGRRLGACKPTS